MRPDTKSGGGGVQFASGPIQKVGGVQFASSLIRKVGGGGVQFASGPIRKVGGGGQFASSPIRKVGAFVWRTANTLSLIINGYNFGRGGCSSTRSTLSGYATDVGHWLHRHIIHRFMASNCSKIKCPCCIMDTPLAPSPLKPTPPFIQTLLVVHCQQTCGKEIRAGEYSTHKCAEEPGPSDADVQTACHTVTGFHQLSTDRLREKGAESIHTKLTSCNVRTIRYMTQLEDCP